MAQILELRHEVAQLVGYPNYAEYSLATKMASSVEEVRAFLEQLAHQEPSGRAARVRGADAVRRPQARTRGTSRSTPSSSSASACNLSEEELRPYFPLPRVLAGMFAVAEKLYGVRIAERSGVDVYHPDAHFYDILNADGSPRGGFFVDLYARPKKRGGAWMDECVGRKRLADTASLPVAYLVCNFMPPVRRAAVAPDALRSRDDVPRVRPRPAPHADARRLSEHRRHQRRRLGCGRAAEPVHGELRVARRSAAADLSARRDG